MVETTDIPSRLAVLRNLMSDAGIHALIIPHADPHQSEYPSDHWLARAYFSGFTGSAGVLIVTGNASALMTDSRYWLQAEQQLAGSGIELLKEGLPGVPSMVDWICSHIPGGGVAAVDGDILSASGFESLKADFDKKDIALVAEVPDIYSLWPERPALPQGIVKEHLIEFAGQSAKDKIDLLMKSVNACRADAVLIGDLAEIAWLLNIRCDDVRCNPVATSYFYCSSNRKVFFVDDSKLDTRIRTYFDSMGVGTELYSDVKLFLKSLPEDCKIIVDPSRLSYAVVSEVASRAIPMQSMLQLPKSIKNQVQLEGMKNAHVRDGVALVKGFMQIESAVSSGMSLTELDVDRILTERRAEQPLNDGLSFETIAGYGSHGAIVHYTATADSASRLEADGLLLVDSGGQYQDGTTDITRTISLGYPTEEQRRDYTMVLQGNIDLACAIFPAGTRGAQLDVLARMPMWRHHHNYLHGTGHGVGQYLNVHEGPHSVRMQENPVALQSGMILSDEPGLYLTGKYGIRLENLLVVVKDGEGDYGDYYRFEVLTLYPFDACLTDFTVLTAAQRDWLRQYHVKVLDVLSPYLDDREAQWLYDKCYPFIN